MEGSLAVLRCFCKLEQARVLSPSVNRRLVRRLSEEPWARAAPKSEEGAEQDNRIGNKYIATWHQLTIWLVDRVTRVRITEHRSKHTQKGVRIVHFR